MIVGINKRAEHFVPQLHKRTVIVNVKHVGLEQREE